MSSARVAVEVIALRTSGFLRTCLRVANRHYSIKQGLSLNKVNSCSRLSLQSANPHMDRGICIVQR